MFGGGGGTLVCSEKIGQTENNSAADNGLIRSILREDF